MCKVGSIIGGHSLGKKRNDKYIYHECPLCNVKRWVYYGNTKRKGYTGLCVHCAGKNQMGEYHPMWKGGRIPDGKGYINILKPNHPLSNKGGYILEHRMIAAEKWGIKALKNMVVHHINEDRADNRIENLCLMRTGEHVSLHIRKPDSTKRKIGEENSIIECVCGCGKTRLKYDKTGRLRTYMIGHYGGKEGVLINGR